MFDQKVAVITIWLNNTKLNYTLLREESALQRSMLNEKSAHEMWQIQRT